MGSNGIVKGELVGVLGMGGSVLMVFMVEFL